MAAAVFVASSAYRFGGRNSSGCGQHWGVFRFTIACTILEKVGLHQYRTCKQGFIVYRANVCSGTAGREEKETVRQVFFVELYTIKTQLYSASYCLHDNV
jgi:hypothetical protein